MSGIKQLFFNRLNNNFVNDINDKNSRVSTRTRKRPEFFNPEYVYFKPQKKVDLKKKLKRQQAQATLSSFVLSERTGVESYVLSDEYHPDRVNLENSSAKIPLNNYIDDIINCAVVNDEDNETSSQYPGKSVSSNKEGFFQVEDILNRRQLSNGDSEFLIRWMGCSPEDDTWESYSNLNEHCQRLIYERFSYESPRINESKPGSDDPLQLQMLEQTQFISNEQNRKCSQQVMSSLHHTNNDITRYCVSFNPNNPNESNNNYIHKPMEQVFFDDDINFDVSDVETCSPSIIDSAFVDAILNEDVMKSFTESILDTDIANMIEFLPTVSETNSGTLETTNLLSNMVAIPKLNSLGKLLPPNSGFTQTQRRNGPRTARTWATGPKMTTIVSNQSNQRRNHNISPESNLLKKTKKRTKSRKMTVRKTKRGETKATPSAKTKKTTLRLSTSSPHATSGRRPISNQLREKNYLDEILRSSSSDDQKYKALMELSKSVSHQILMAAGQATVDMDSKISQLLELLEVIQKLNCVKTSMTTCSTCNVEEESNVVQNFIPKSTGIATKDTTKYPTPTDQFDDGQPDDVNGVHVQIDSPCAVTQTSSSCDMDDIRHDQGSQERDIGFNGIEEITTDNHDDISYCSRPMEDNHLEEDRSYTNDSSPYFTPRTESCIAKMNLRHITIPLFETDGETSENEIDDNDTGYCTQDESPTIIKASRSAGACMDSNDRFVSFSSICSLSFDQ